MMDCLRQSGVDNSVMRTSIHVGIMCLALVLLVALVAADEPGFTNIKAREAAASYDKEQRRAEDDYSKRMTAARTKYLEALAAAKNAAMKNGNLDDANRMQAAIERLSEDIKATARPAKAEGSLVVRSAQYGAGDRWADVTKNVRSHLRGGGMTNFYEGFPDPAHGVEKNLVIEGTYGGKEFVLTCGEDRSNYYFGEPPRGKAPRK
jgi:hypothetical protein